MSLPKIEPIISELLERGSISRPPVSMAKIARLWPGLEVTLEDIDGEGFILDLGRVGGQIMVKRETRLERQRYSVAHELGHWQLKDYGIPLNGSLQDDRDQAVERWCNRFAGALLMPKAWIKNELRGAQGLELVNRILQLPGKYKVSRESAYIRVAEVSFINILELTRVGDSWKNRQYRSRLMPVNLDKYIEPLQSVLQKGPFTGSHVFEVGNELHYKIVRKEERLRQWLVAFF
jgi:Zn-dependent peptidase ImmA (M78 family)